MCCRSNRIYKVNRGSVDSEPLSLFLLPSPLSPFNLPEWFQNVLARNPREGEHGTFWPFHSLLSLYPEGSIYPNRCCACTELHAISLQLFFILTTITAALTGVFGFPWSNQMPRRLPATENRLWHTLREYGVLWKTSNICVL